MNLDELQSIRDRERQSDSLQQLREDFYVEVGEFVGDLREEREAAADRADDPFDAPEVNRLTDDIKTAEQTVEAIYERRVGKLVKMASFAAADMPTEDEGLTAEERELFERMVAAIEGNRETVMSVVDGEDPPATPGQAASRTATETDPESETVDPEPPSPTPEQRGREERESADTEPTPPTGADDDGVNPADLMAGSGPVETDAEPEAPSRAEGGAAASDSTPDGTGHTASEGQAPAAGAENSATDAPSGTDDGPGESSGDDGRSEAARHDGGTTTVDRETVRITDDVGRIFGIDEREYDLAREDVVTLPSENAAPLVERDVAERLD